MHQIVSKMMFLFLAPPTGNGTFLRRSPPMYVFCAPEWSHLNPIRSGAARNTTPVKFSELNGPRMRHAIRIFLEI